MDYIKYGGIGCLILVGLLVLSAVGMVFGVISFGIQDTGNVVKKEFSPSAMLKKYEWFKDASAQLDKKNADILVYENRITAMQETYKGIPRTEWPRTDLEQYNIWAAEVAGVKASFNDLAAQYNSQMAKFNYRFANRGMLPEGATEPLPREYKPYVTQ